MNLGLTGAVKVPFLDFGEIVDTKLRSHAEKRCHLIISWYYIDFLSYIFIVSEEYKDYTFDYDDMAG